MRQLMLFISDFDANPSDFKVPQTELGSGSFSTILQIVFGFASAVAIIMIMIAAIKYVTSRGDPQGVAKAKNTILFAIIGLVIAASAFSIVTFVVKNV